MKILISIFLISFLISCSVFQEKNIEPDEHEKIDSTWASPLKEGTFVPIRHDLFVFEGVLQNTDKKLVIDIQGLLALKNKITNYKTRVYNSTVYFNTEALKKFVEVNKVELKKIYGPNANIYIFIESLKWSPFQFYFAELNQYSSNWTHINIDPMDKPFIELKDICNYANYEGCKAKSEIPFYLMKDDKISLRFRVGIITDETKSEGFYAKQIEIDYDPTL